MLRAANTLSRSPLKTLPCVPTRFVHSGGWNGGRGWERAAFTWPTGLHSGMDMSRAPGYQVPADDPACKKDSARGRLSAFAVRHGGLSEAQAAAAQGFLWVGPVIHAAPPEYPWAEAVQFEDDQHVHVVHTPPESAAPTTRERTAERVLKRRYTGGQARRIRQQREEARRRREHKKSQRRSLPKRKPWNDIPRGDDDS